MKPLWCVILLLGVGCGLTDYEAQLERTQSRLAEFDREQELLGGPLQMPISEPRLFLQPPRGIQHAPTARTRPNSADDWLTHFPWGNATDKLPPLELLIGVKRKQPGEAPPDSIYREIATSLQQHAGGKEPLAKTSFDKPETYARPSDLPSQRTAVAYQRCRFTSDEKPLWPVPSRANAPSCVYQYDVFLHDADEWWVVIIFKQLDRPATEERWRKLPASEAKGLTLPDMDPVHVAMQRRISLATLRIGRAAEEKFRLRDD